MLRPSFTGQFKQDRKLARKRGWDIARLDAVIERLIAADMLESRYHVHKLRGNYVGHWECHIEPDFLVIWYQPSEDEIVFVRTGSHADLFG